jgi:pyrroline-5-carboxylate reductase
MKIAIIGAGEMGGAFAKACLKATFSSQRCDGGQPPRRQTREICKDGGQLTPDNKAAVEGADYVVVV